MIDYATITSTEELLRERDALPVGDRGRLVRRNLAIEQNLSMAGRLARRYRGRGVPLDDLNQVAALALITAVDRFDSSRSTQFVSFAVPTILGSLKRYFRDATWGMRVPRATQELVGAISAAVSGLNQELGRTPSTADIADYLDADLEAVAAAMTAFHAYRQATLSAAGLHAEGSSIVDVVGEIDLRYAILDDRLELRPLVAALPAREREILVLYYYGHMTQAGIAAEVGISQMHVSRLLKRSLSMLRTGLGAPEPAPVSAHSGPAHSGPTIPRLAIPVSTGRAVLIPAQAIASRVIRRPAARKPAVRELVGALSRLP